MTDKINSRAESETAPIPEVRLNAAASRFELRINGQTAVLEYTLRDDTITLVHTEVPAELEGRGFGSQLARAGLEYARKKEFKVLPVCEFVAGFIERHAEYQDLVKQE
jgi:predicted GNAT family acetyltransferase